MSRRIDSYLRLAANGNLLSAHQFACERWTNGQLIGERIVLHCTVVFRVSSTRHYTEFTNAKNKIPSKIPSERVVKNVTQ